MPDKAASRRTEIRSRERGQIIVVFALGLTAMILALGLVVDGGYAWAQRRAAQNAADLASLAGTRIVALKLAGATVDGTAILTSMNQVNAANGVPNVSAGGAVYVDNKGTSLGTAVANGQPIPAAARGILASTARTWRPYFLGLMGVSTWSASAEAISKADLSRIDDVPAGDLLPLAMPLNSVPGNVCPEGTPASSCTAVNVAAGSGSGQFGWMSWSGVGNAVYTCDIMTPPLDNPAYSVPTNGYITIPGNTGVSASSCLKSAFQYWIDSGATIYVPIISPGPGPCPSNCFPGTSTPYPVTSQGHGSNVTYNVIGFAGFQLTGCDGSTDASKCKIDNIQGVYRQVVFNGPTGAGNPGGSTLTGTAIQLVK
ncbi:MAG TPA: pilus assembly protein TadG-related protein [Candidatus Limnocylindrales bacterium]|nr:pilus assembly protein TadG-related protein [Candidatus Limnocylindrales bacterium]